MSSRLRWAVAFNSGHTVLTRIIADLPARSSAARRTSRCILSGFQRRYCPAAGLTYIDLLISVVIFLIGLVGMYLAFISLSQLNTVIRHKAMAVYEADLRLEQWRNVALEAMPAIGSIENIPVVSDELRRLSGAITETTEDIAPTLKQISVRVVWLENGRTQHMELVSRFANRPD